MLIALRRLHLSAQPNMRSASPSPRLQLTELLELAGEPPLPTEGCSEAVQAALAQLLAATAAGSKPEDLGAAVREELQDWLRRQLAGLAERLGCGLPVLPPWAGQAAEGAAAAAGGPAEGAAAGEGKAGEPLKAADGKQQQQQQQEQSSAKAGGGRKKGKAAATAAAAAAAPAAEPSAAAAQAAAAAGAAAGEPPHGRLATAAYMHPYTELMLRHPVQQHTVQQALEAPAPDAALNGLPRTTTMGQLEAATAGGAAAGEGETAATPAASALTATPGTGGLLKEVPSVANLSSLLQQPAATVSTAAVASTAGGAADTAGTADAAASPAAALDGTPMDAAAAAAEGAAQQHPASAPAARTGGRARAVSNYALLAGKKQTNRNATGPPKKVGRGGVLWVGGSGVPRCSLVLHLCSPLTAALLLAGAGGAHADGEAGSGGGKPALGGTRRGGPGGSRWAAFGHLAGGCRHRLPVPLLSALSARKAKHAQAAGVAPQLPLRLAG